MSQNTSSNLESGNNFQKWLVRVLLIVGIGVPVLIELFTFSGLIRSHFFGNTDKKTANQAVQEKETGDQVTRGDTLFQHSSNPILVNKLQLEIYPDKWVFSMELVPVKKASIDHSRDSVEILINSLKTSERKIPDVRKKRWGMADTAVKKTVWTLNSSEQPLGATISLAIDSLNHTGSLESRYFKFGHIPASYYK